MFLSNIMKQGKTVKVQSKKTGAEFNAKLVFKSELDAKFDMFQVGGSIVWRDSLRRRYQVK